MARHSALLSLTSSGVNRSFSSVSGRWSSWAWPTPSLPTIAYSSSSDSSPVYYMKYVQQNFDFLRFYVQADTENHCRRHLLGLRFNSTHNIYHAVGPTILINSSLMHVLVVMWGHHPSVHTRPFIVQVLPSYIFESRIFHLSPIADFI